MRILTVRSLTGLAAACALVAALTPHSLSADTWLPEKRLTDSWPEAYISHGNARCLAADGSGNVHLVWYQMQEDTGSAKWQILYKWFNGAVWGGTTVLSEAVVASHPSLVAAPGGSLHVVWAEGGSRIVYKMCDGVAWGSTQYLTPAGGEVYTPSLARDAAGLLHLVWCDCRDGDDEIYYKVFDGAAWGPDTRLTEAPGLSLNPAVTVDHTGKAHVAWYDWRDGAAEIYYKVWDGVAWGPDTRLTYAGTNAAQPAIAADPSGRIYVAWGDYRDGNNEIYVKAWDGTAWGPDTRLTYSGGTSWNPSLAADDSCHVHMAWFDGRHGDPEIYYKEFDGLAWTADQRLSNAVEPSENPSVAVDALGAVHVVWQDDRNGNYDIYWTARGAPGAPGMSLDAVDHPVLYAGEVVTLGITGSHLVAGTSVRLTSAGEPDLVGANAVVTTPTGMRADFNIPSATRGAYDLIGQDPGGGADTLFGAVTVVRGWNDAERLTNAPAESRTSKPGADCVAADPNGNIHVVWYDTRDGACRIYYKRYDGSAWSTDQVISGTIVRSYYPSVAADGTCSVHVVWAAQPEGTNWRVYYTVFAGGAWTAPAVLTAASPNALYPCVACDSQNRPHVVWEDKRSSIYDIYYKYRSGGAWSADLALVSVGKDCHQPALAVDASDNLHVVWNDFRSGNWEIYYKKRTGATWGADERLTNDTVESFGADLAVDALGLVHVVWKGGYSYAEIYYEMFDGLSWSSATLLSDGLNRSSNPAVTVDESGALHVVWQYHYGTAYWNDQIRYASKTGPDWWTGRHLTNQTYAYSVYAASPSVAANPTGGVHVVWTDNGPGNYEIFHKAWIPGYATSDTPSGGYAGLRPALAVYPNPAAGTAAIAFSLNEAARPRLEVFDIRGRLVWQADPGVKGPGRHDIVWDGKRSDGRKAGPGIYFIRLGIGAQSLESKVVLTR